MKQKHRLWLLRCSTFAALLILLSVFLRSEPQPVLAATTNPNCTQTLGPWVSAPQVPSNHIEGAAAVVNGKLYLFSGFAAVNPLTPSNRIDVFNAATNVWESVQSPRGPMPFSGSHFWAAVEGQYVWLAGGFLGTHPGAATANVWRYDTVNDLWEQMVSLPQARAAGGLVVVGRKLYYMGGVGADRQTDQAVTYVLNLDNPTNWTTVASMTRARNHFQAVAIDDLIYTVAGQQRHDTQPADTRFLDVYNPATNAWSTRADLALVRSHFESATVVANDRILAVGGKSVSTARGLVNVSEYNPQTNTWTELRSLPTALYEPSVGVVGNKLIVTAGGLAWNIHQRNTWISEISTNCVIGTPAPTPASPTGQSVNSLTLINADTDQEIGVMTNGMVISFAAL